MIDKDSAKINRSINWRLNVTEKIILSCVFEEIRYKFYALKQYGLTNKPTVKRRKDKATRMLC